MTRHDTSYRQLVTEIMFRIDTVQTAVPEQLVQLRTPVAAVIRPEEQMIYSPQTHRQPRIFYKGCYPALPSRRWHRISTRPTGSVHTRTPSPTHSALRAFAVFNTLLFQCVQPQHRFFLPDGQTFRRDFAPDAGSDSLQLTDAPQRFGHRLRGHPHVHVMDFAPRLRSAGHSHYTPLRYSLLNPAYVSALSSPKRVAIVAHGRPQATSFGFAVPRHRRVSGAQLAVRQHPRQPSRPGDASLNGARRRSSSRCSVVMV